MRFKEPMKQKLIDALKARAAANKIINKLTSQKNKGPFDWIHDMTWQAWRPSKDGTWIEVYYSEEDFKNEVAHGLQIAEGDTMDTTTVDGVCIVYGYHFNTINAYHILDMDKRLPDE